MGTANGSELIAAERRRQVEVEEWTPEHDDEHEHGEMAAAAQCYLEATPHQFQRNIRLWPWAAKWWKPKDRISNLVRAGALIAAEIDRLQRAKERPEEAHAWDKEKAETGGNTCDHYASWEFVRHGDPDEAEVPVDVFFCHRCKTYQDQLRQTADSPVSKHNEIRRESE